MANVKLGNNTLTGVSAVRLQNADVAGEYVSFGLGVLFIDSFKRGNGGLSLTNFRNK